MLSVTLRVFNGAAVRPKLKVKVDFYMTPDEPGTTPLDPVIESQFTYHPPFGSQQERYVAIRDKAKELAYVIKSACPSCADTTAAIRHLREAVMTANAAIACNETNPNKQAI